MPSFYRSLLYLYPRDHRQEFGEEMMGVFQEAQTEVIHRGFLAGTAFWARELQGIVGGALREHIRSLAGPRRHLPLHSGRFTMRSEFRFPKATTTLMTIILGAVVLAIEKATAIVNSVPHTSQHVGPIQPVHFTLLQTLLLIASFACVSGALGWAILFALHRSGVQRLADFDPSRELDSRSRLSA